MLSDAQSGLKRSALAHIDLPAPPNRRHSGVVRLAAPRRRGTMANSTSTHDGIRLFLDDLDRYPLPDHEEQVELAKRVAAGDDEARRQMISANLRLVVHWARRYQDRGVDFGDLVQEGTFGLLRAGDKTEL